MAHLVKGSVDSAGHRGAHESVGHRRVVRTGAAGHAGVVRIEWAGSEAAHLLN
ncbi:hypothetical protein ABZ348_32000 [Streptomyces sp. NPDC005963]|uniref:hypothetical protein n=1 Tax=Streptomyces sp. NPDC005963 TaxID=3156721 RepID=UPI00340A369C